MEDLQNYITAAIRESVDRELLVTNNIINELEGRVQQAEEAKVDALQQIERLQEELDLKNEDLRMIEEDIAKDDIPPHRLREMLARAIRANDKLWKRHKEDEATIYLLANQPLTRKRTRFNPQTPPPSPQSASR